MSRPGRSSYLDADLFLCSGCCCLSIIVPVAATTPTRIGGTFGSRLAMRISNRSDYTLLHQCLTHLPRFMHILVRHNRVRRHPVIPAPEPLTDIQLPFTIDGTIVSTAGILLFMDTVEIKGSNISVLQRILDSNNVALKSYVVHYVLQKSFHKL